MKAPVAAPLAAGDQAARPVVARGEPPPAAPAPAAAEQAPPSPASAEQAATSPRSTAIADVALATLLLALGVLVLVSSVRMGIGWGSDGPESGFVPFWLSLLLVGCCALTVARARRRVWARPFVRRDQLGRVLQVLLPATAMIALTLWLGMYVAGALYMALYMRWGGRYSWAASLALPLCFTVLIFLVFERWFLVPLPKGPLEAWLGY